MKIIGINFGNNFSNRKLRFDSNSNTNVDFEKRLDGPDRHRNGYGYERKRRHDAPMVRYALPPEPKRKPHPIDPGKKPPKNIWGPKPYLRYSIPGHFNY